MLQKSLSLEPLISYAQGYTSNIFSCSFFFLLLRSCNSLEDVFESEHCSSLGIRKVDCVEVVGMNFACKWECAIILYERVNGLIL